MFEIHTSHRLTTLVDHLGKVLSEVPSDPMESEWIATPSAAMQRWLLLQLATRLGAGIGGDDGVAANIVPAFPGTLLTSVLEADHESSTWGVERVAWATLRTIQATTDDPLLAGLSSSSNRSRYAIARRIADLFDRYNLHRPEMIRSWATGLDVDGVGQDLSQHQLWQPHLWRAVRSEMSCASPAERLPHLLPRLAAGDLTLDLPRRLIMFGLTVVPGGPGFLSLAEAVGAHHDLHLYMFDPSPAASNNIRQITENVPESSPRNRVAHPLLESWSRPAMASAAILRSAPLHSLDPSDLVEHDIQVGSETTASHLLGRLQHDLLTDSAPGSDLVVDPHDRSIEIHACYGTMRQVEALRDSVLCLLESDPTLSEDDIAVMTPDLERFAPLIEAAFGPSAPLQHFASPASAAEADAPFSPLRYRIADRSIRSANPILVAVDRLLEMATGRFDVTTVLDFLGLEPVRERFHLSDEDLARISHWAESGNVRWGLDPEHRHRHGVSPSLDTNTWQSIVDRLLIGSAIVADSPALAIGELAPEGIEGSDVEVAAKLASIVDIFRGLSSTATGETTVAEWLNILLRTSASLLAAPRSQPWQIEHLERVADEISSTIDDGPPPQLTFDDFRRLINGHLDGRSGRPDFFRGGLTITSLRPLRSIPHRVVCMLGIDQSSMSTPSPDGDDLMVASPLLGDFDPRGEARQALLEVLLSTQDSVLIFRDGNDIRTNDPIPRSTVLEELIDALAAMFDPAERAAFVRSIEITHPRQPYDERNFIEGGLVPGVVAGFDSDAFAGAEARRERSMAATSTNIPTDANPISASDNPETIHVDELRALLSSPCRFHAVNSLHLRLPRSEDELSSLLPVSPSGLDRWQLGELMLNTQLSDSGDSDEIDHVMAVERRRGSIPPGQLGESHIETVRSVVTELLESAELAGVESGPGDPHTVSVVIDESSKICGLVESRLGNTADGRGSGPATVSYSTWKPAHLVEAWLKLMCLTATDPDTTWRAVTINPLEGGEPKGAESWEIGVVGETPFERSRTSRDALTIVAELHRQALVEPLPLFAVVSHGLYLQTRPDSQLSRPGRKFGRASLSNRWEGSQHMKGDLSDPYVSLFYGGLSLGEVMKAGAQQFADLLWGAIDASIEIDQIKVDQQ